MIHYKDAGDDGEDALMSQINTTPLVDVMLVLLIIFLITIPVVNSSIFVSLPREPNAARDAQLESVIVTVDAQGRIFWFDTPLPQRAALGELLARIAAMRPQPELHIRGDVRADYEAVGHVVFAAQQAGIARVGFVTEPPSR
jgi:biopolymer transport protein ExbD